MKALGVLWRWKFYQKHSLTWLLQGKAKIVTAEAQTKFPICFLISTMHLNLPFFISWNELPLTYISLPLSQADEGDKNRYAHSLWVCRGFPFKTVPSESEEMFACPMGRDEETNLSTNSQLKQFSAGSEEETNFPWGNSSLYGLNKDTNTQLAVAQSHDYGTV